MQRLPIALLAAALAFPAETSDKYIVHDDRPMDDARRPVPGKALIYFVRTQTAGFAIKFKLYADGRFVGLLMSRTYIPVEVDPGKHEFVTEAENAGFLEAEVAPGSPAPAAKRWTNSLTTMDEGVRWVKEGTPISTM